MNTVIIKKIQKHIIQLLPVNKKNQRCILLSDSCSELAYLVASWIIKLDKTNHIFIIKGKNVCNTKKSHDILIVTTSINLVYIVDPSIWQFFPQAKSILVTIVDDVNFALYKIRTIYGGQWSKNEELIQLDKNEEREYLNIIYQNIHESLN